MKTLDRVLAGALFAMFFGLCVSMIIVCFGDPPETKAREFWKDWHTGY